LSRMQLTHLGFVVCFLQTFTHTVKIRRKTNADVV
jgi:hypothetical protein